jgi:hypothetical protein
MSAKFSAVHKLSAHASRTVNDRKSARLGSEKLVSAGPKVRTSFRPPAPVQQQWTRNPRMEKISFNRITASYSFDDGLEVKFEMDVDVWESIEIAMDYDKDGDEGLIGKGLSKMGIYVSIKFTIELHSLPHFRLALTGASMFSLSMAIP